MGLLRNKLIALSGKKEVTSWFNRGRQDIIHWQFQREGNHLKRYACSDLKEVAFAEPSEAGLNDALVYIPDDPDFSRLWGLHNTGQTVNQVTGSVDADVDQ